MTGKVSFAGIGEVVATFAVQEGVRGGQPVKLTGNGQVGPCGDGDPFCGVAPGWAELAADGNGGVRTAGAGQGVRVLVASAQSDREAVVCL